jgi:hypothetical protein
MIKIGYIILVHQNPGQLVRLMRTLESNSTCFFIHIDKRKEISQFMSFKGFSAIKNLYLLKRFNSYWGSIGLVNATMEGIRSALKHGCEYIILLSGSDYPIKSKEVIDQFLSKNRGKNFVSFYKMPAPHWLPNKEINRIKKFYFHLNNKLFEYPNPPELKSKPRKLLNLILSIFLPKERIFPKGIIPFGGDQWFCITGDAGQELLRFYNHHPEVMKFLKHCLIPDEIFVQTALLNSNNNDLISSISNDTITYINWVNRGQAPSPELLTSADLAQLKITDKLFARKFDHDKYPDLGNRIDSELLGILKHQII